MDKIEQAVETYLAKLYRLRSTGGATAETSFYSALEELLNAIGNDLKPKVFCLSQLADQGAGHPDFGLFTAAQCQRGQPRPGNVPERGVVEVKPLRENAWFTAETSQVSKYWGRYRFVVVTNFRSFLMIGEDRNGNAARLEAYQLAATEQAFWDVARTAQSSAKAFGKSFGEYLRRALTQSVPLREPKDVAWFLASHARDALARVEAKGTLRALATVRNALEQALGVRFEGEKGEHFFRSTLVQTLFYGVFSAWVLWAKSKPAPIGRFDWRTAVWHLNVPMIRALFAQLSEPGRLRPLDLVEVLDWTEAALNRVEQSAFFARFQEAEAVEYFYEPFLEAFDPELSKQLGVWYTPPEVVTYMVERIDRGLRDDLRVEDGLAAENVYVLDPCCGTGSFLAAVLRRISATLEQRGYGALGRPAGQEGGDRARLRLRAIAGAVRRRALAGRVAPAGPRRAPLGRCRRTRRHLSHQRAHRLGAGAGPASRCPSPSWPRNAERAEASSEKSRSSSSSATRHTTAMRG